MRSPDGKALEILGEYLILALTIQDWELVFTVAQRLQYLSTADFPNPQVYNRTDEKSAMEARLSGRWD